MKSKNILILWFIFSVVFIISCEKESADVSEITNYPVFTMTGASEILHPLGTAFTDPGVTAKEGGAIIPVTVDVNGVYSSYSNTTVDGTLANKYEIEYSAINKQGLPGSVMRTVYVAGTGDLVNSIEGLYTSTVSRNGATPAAQYTEMQYVMIWKTGANTYQISDCIGGYYDIGRAYGAGYMASGMTITATDIPTNSFTFGSGVGVGAFGGLCEMNYMTVDAANKTIEFKSTWDSGYNFVVTLKQIAI